MLRRIGIEVGWLAGCGIVAVAINWRLLAPPINRDIAVIMSTILLFILRRVALLRIEWLKEMLKKLDFSAPLKR